MALNEAECQKCRLELGKLKARYEGAGEVPDVAKARLSELESALDSECSSSGGSDAGAAAALILGGSLLIGGLLAIVLGSRQ